MKLSIITPVYNNWNFTQSYLNDLSKLPNDHKIIIIDNNSTDNTVNNIKDNYKDIILIENKENKGFGYASNQGYQIAKGEYILFLNNDIRVKSNQNNWTEELIKEAENGYLVGPTGGLLDERYNFVKECNELLEGNSYISGWCLCGRKDVFDKLCLSMGPWDSDNFFAYFEDPDLFMRARQLGIKGKIVSVPVVHFGKMTSKKIGLSKMYSKSKTTFLNKWMK